MVQYVVFNLATGAPVKWGQCQLETLAMQAGEGEVALETSSLDVAGNRSIIWERVKVKREERYNAGVTTPYGVLDTTPESRDFINGLVTIAVAAVIKDDTAFSRNFTKADDTQVTLNAMQIIAAGELVEAYINNTHQHSQTLRAQINSAEDMAELLAIDITVGWP